MFAYGACSAAVGGLVATMVSDSPVIAVLATAVTALALGALAPFAARRERT
jgi:hypothetical protein